MDAKAIQNLIGYMLEASKVTLSVFFLTLVFGLTLGLFVAFLRMSKHFIIRGPIMLYLLIMRGTPLILQLMFFYFGPAYIFDIMIPRFWAAILACSLNYAAYFAEIYRGGIESMPKGQYEAGTVLGFTKVQTFKKIILPQVIKRILPSMGNEFMTLVKDTSLVQVIGVAELFRLATSTTSTTGSTIPLVIAGAFYLVMNTVVSKAFAVAEKRLSYYN